MFDELKENFLNTVTSRLFLLFLVLAAACAVLIYRVFDLQIVHGEEFLDTFQLKIRKERSITATRGNIYDRHGNLLAYNNLSYSVTIEDVYESGRTKNDELNGVIRQLIAMIESCGDQSVSGFPIILDADNNYAFTTEDREDRQLRRFLADVYGKRSFDELDYRQQSSTAEDIVNYLGQTPRFGIGEFENPEERDNFIVGKGYEKSEVLKLMTIRYDMSLNSFQKYIATTVATNVNTVTVAKVMENMDSMPGVQISEDTARRYVDSIYFAHILGYTGKPSQDELEQFRTEPGGVQYDMNDTIGKLGIERSMEHILQGQKGHETVFVNNVGRVLSTSDYAPPIAGDNVHLTIDKNLQIAVYHILEEKIASIIYTKLRNIKEYLPGPNATATDIVIPIYDVYYALIGNNVIDLRRFSAADAGVYEKAAHGLFVERREDCLVALMDELGAKMTPYALLEAEQKSYQDLSLEILYSRGVIERERINTQDPVYMAYMDEGEISLAEFIRHAIAMNWIDISKLSLTSQYSDAEEIYAVICDYVITALGQSYDFDKRVFHYMIYDDIISGLDLCHILLEQEAVTLDAEDLQDFLDGRTGPYQFMSERIARLDLTPAQLALDPYSGSAVITDVNTGDVLALVTYPGYDNNKMANGVDAAYYASLLNDLSRPMINYATQQRTAPGSTFKLLSAAAGLLEGIINTSSTCLCSGIFEEVVPPPRCWIYPGGTHGTLNLTEAITHSCNIFFYDIGYKAGMFDGVHSADEGIHVLSKYTEMFGLDDLSGIEIDEALPHSSTYDPVRSAIGQGNANYSTVGLARYVTTVANNGSCYDLTLIDKISDHDGNSLNVLEPVLRSSVPLAASEWGVIKQGMRAAVEMKTYFDDLAVEVAGKTGTAQESVTRPSHALFVGFAPYEVPEISLATRVAFGYSSDYASQIAREIIKYYYGLAERDEIITGVATELIGGTSAVD